MLYDTPLVAYTMIEIRENIIVQVTYHNDHYEYQL